MADPYQILGIAPDASSDEIASAYRVLADIYRPDRLEKSTLEVRTEATRRMFEVNTAYEELLSVPVINVDYDTEGWTNRQRAEATKSLLDADIPHEWDGTSLLLSPDHEDAADRILYG